MIPKAILNKVTKLNEMIALHIDSDGDAIGVIDTNGTWNAPIVYSIIVGLNSIRIDSYDIYANESKVYDTYKFNKSNEWVVSDCNDTLNDLIKQYRKSIKSLN